MRGGDQRGGLGVDAIGEALGDAGIGRVRCGLEVQVGATGDRDRVEDLGRVERETRTGGEVEQLVAGVGDERVDVDERLDVGQSRAGVGGDEATVGVRTSTTGPGIVWRKLRRYTLSSIGPRSGLGGTTTL